LEFYKYNGLGNDFIIINCFGHLEKPITASDEVRKICDRRMEIGADGVVNVMDSEMADARMLIMNSDGSRAEMCGNAIRCFAKFVYDNSFIHENKISIETDAGIMEVEIEDDNGFMKTAKVNMGYAYPEHFGEEPEKQLHPEEGIDRILKIGMKLTDFVSDNRVIEDENIYFMNMGVPHAVVFMKDIRDELVTTIGPLIEKHPGFKRGTNVNFAKVLNSGEIEMKTWERGAGYTMACGTGSCATLVASKLTGRTKDTAKLILRGGELNISMKEAGQVTMEGPASFSFKGSWDRNNIEVR